MAKAKTAKKDGKPSNKQPKVNRIGDQPVKRPKAGPRCSC